MKVSQFLDGSVVLPDHEPLPGSIDVGTFPRRHPRDGLGRLGPLVVLQAEICLACLHVVNDLVSLRKQTPSANLISLTPLTSSQAMSLSSSSGSSCSSPNDAP